MECTTTRAARDPRDKSWRADIRDSARRICGGPNRTCLSRHGFGSNRGGYPRATGTAEILSRQRRGASGSERTLSCRHGQRQVTFVRRRGSAKPDALRPHSPAPLIGLLHPRAHTGRPRSSSETVREPTCQGARRRCLRPGFTSNCVQVLFNRVIRHPTTKTRREFFDRSVKISPLQRFRRSLGLNSTRRASIEQARHTHAFAAYAATGSTFCSSFRQFMACAGFPARVIARYALDVRQSRLGWRVRAFSTKVVGVPQQNGEIVYWHREMPPRDSEPIGDHTIEATSARVSGTLAHRDDLWEVCYQQLMESARSRLKQEITRLGGDYAHVMKERIEPRHDDRTGEAWMYGCFDYELYRRTSRPISPAVSPNR
jgi:hypothetical protein